MTRTRLLALCAALMVATPVAAQSTVPAQKVGLSQERLARIGTVLNGEIEKGNLPGAVLLVARRGEIA